MSKYLEILSKFNIEPNFECSPEYFEAAEWIEQIQAGVIRVMDQIGSQMLPSIDLTTGKVLEDPCFIGLPANTNPDFPVLDHEFIYEGLPVDFDFKGGPWKTTRKNMRKAEKLLGVLGFELIHPDDPKEKQDQIQAAIEKMLIDWGKNRQLYGADLFCHFALKGKNRMIVKTPDDTIVGLLVWDGNYKYVNFRICLTAPVDGLSDWCRVKFRQIIGRKFPQHLINDGGVCKDPNLYKYKKRLCPLKVNEIRTISTQPKSEDKTQ